MNDQENFYQAARTLLLDGKIDEAAGAFEELIEAAPDFEKGYVGRGHCLLRRGELDQALTAFEKAVELNPRWDAAFVLRGFVLEQLGRAEEAHDDYSRAIKLKPKEDEHWLRRAALASGSLGRPKDAIKDCKKVLARSPRNTLAHCLLGSSLLALSREKEARVAFRKAAAIDPRDTTALSGLGECSYKLEQYEQSIEENGQCLAVDPNHYSALLHTALARGRLGEHRAAFDGFTEVLRRHPTSVRAASNRAIAALAVGEYRSAIADVNYVLVELPGNAYHRGLRGKAHLLLGEYDKAEVDLQAASEAAGPEATEEQVDYAECLEKLGKRERALEEYKRVLKGNPTHPVASGQCYNLLMAMNRYDELVRMCKRALAKDPRCAQAWWNLGLAHENRDRNDDAIEAYSKAIRAEPTNGMVYWMRGECYLEKHLLPKARRDFEKAIEKNYSKGHVGLGRLLIEEEDFEGAIRELTRAVELRESDSEAYYWRGRAYYHLGRMKEAKRNYERAQFLEPDLYTEDWDGEPVVSLKSLHRNPDGKTGPSKRRGRR